MSLIEKVYEKQGWEQEPLKFNWKIRAASQVNDGYAVSAFEFKVFDSLGVDVSLDMISGAPWISGDYLIAFVKGGINGSDYYGRIRITLTKAAFEDYKIEADLLIQVRQEGVA